MQNKRLTRVNELLKREIANVLYREMNEFDFDMAAVTVTRVEVSSNLRNARVYVSLRGDESTCTRMLNTIRHHRAHIQQLIRRDVILKYTPVLHFERDRSLAEGDRVLHLLAELDPGDEALPDDADPDAPDDADDPDSREGGDDHG